MTNFIDNNGIEDITHLYVFNFFEDPSDKIDNLIGDEYVFYD